MCGNMYLNPDSTVYFQNNRFLDFHCFSYKSLQQGHQKKHDN